MDTYIKDDNLNVLSNKYSTKCQSYQYTKTSNIHQVEVSLKKHYNNKYTWSEIKINQNIIHRISNTPIDYNYSSSICVVDNLIDATWAKHADKGSTDKACKCTRTLCVHTHLRINSRKYLNTNHIVIIFFQLFWEKSNQNTALDMASAKNVYSQLSASDLTAIILQGKIDRLVFLYMRWFDLN